MNLIKTLANQYGLVFQIHLSAQCQARPWTGAFLGNRSHAIRDSRDSNESPKPDFQIDKFGSKEQCLVQEAWA